MKKILSILSGLTAICVSLASTGVVFASETNSLLPLKTQNSVVSDFEGEEQPLYKYVKNADGSYGYDLSKPVYMYNGSTQQVEIPTTYTQPKEQFKTSWVATISNLNIPQPSSEDDFKAKYTERLNTLKEWNMNAMIFQVRPLLDAYYPSEINPSSQFLTGQQGKEIGYDPLEWMVETTHANGMEYHAWLNPYRVTVNKVSDASVLSKIGLTAEQAKTLSIEDHIKAFNQAGILADNNYAVLHPENVLRFDEKLFLNPGRAEVVQHVKDTVNEIITKYDVDAIHFDDYFYPYRLSATNFFGKDNEDRADFLQYGVANGYTDDEEGLENWRRDNVTNLVKGVKDTIDEHNASTGNSVQFGISPFGIWEHKANNPLGSNTPTSSSQSYSKSIYADTYKWIKEELVDYMAPQIYWSFGMSAAPYGELAQWWDNVAQGTRVQIYIGHANYKYLNNGAVDPEWMNPQEIENQMLFNQKYSSIKGDALFSYNDIIPTASPTQPKEEAKNESINVLKSNTFSTPSLVPAKKWLSHKNVNAPQNVTLTGNTLTWNDTRNSNMRFYVVYAGNANEKSEDIILNPANIVQKVAATDAKNYSFNVLDANKKYVVTTLDKAQVESLPATANSTEIEAVKVEVKVLEALKLGKTLDTKVKVEPSTASIEDLKWTVAKPEVASVDANGVITALQVGFTKITAESDNGVKTSFVVRVTN